MGDNKKEQQVINDQDIVKIIDKKSNSTKLEQEDNIKELLSLINVLIKNTNETTTSHPKLTSTTKRFIAGGIFAMGVIVAIGWTIGGITAADALIVISSITTGGFALLRL